MESFILGNRTADGDRPSLQTPDATWVSALTTQRERVSRDVAGLFALSNTRKEAEEDSEDNSDEEDPFSSRPVNNLRLHAMHRRRLYGQFAKDLARLSDAQYFYRLMMWCHDCNVFIHPSVSVQRRHTAYREHVFTVRDDVSRLTPLLAIPECLAIGFRDCSSDAEGRSNLFDEKREKEFNAMNSGESSDTDICQFFFSSLGRIVEDLITAQSSPLTDRRYVFADSLGKVQSLLNAPYFDDSVVFDAKEPCLADVLLQMIRNYINGGPLVNKVTRDRLQWAVSVCLSHSTPLSIGTVKSIGIVPVVHLFPHGGALTNSFVVARTGVDRAAEKMCRFFRLHAGFDFGSLYEGKWIYVVPERTLRAGEEIRLQAMAPVCDRDGEAEQMWRLSCGTAPADYQTSAELAARQARLTQEIIRAGAQILASDDS